MVHPIGKAFMERHFRSESMDWKKGDKVIHPEMGEVTITGGSYWGTHGVSNFWYWKDSKGVEHHGYGWA